MKCQSENNSFWQSQTLIKGSPLWKQAKSQFCSVLLYYVILVFPQKSRLAKFLAMICNIMAGYQISWG